MVHFVTVTTMTLCYNQQRIEGIIYQATGSQFIRKPAYFCKDGLMSQVTLLYQLQQLDTVIRDKKNRLTKVMQEMNEPETLVQARQELETLTAEVAELQTIQRDLELQSGSLQEKYQASHDRMYSGKVTNSRELSDLQLEVDSLQTRRGKLDDRMLENMVQLEEKSEAQLSAENQLQTLTDNWTQKYSNLEVEKHDLASELAKLLADRKELASKIEPKHLRNYLNIAKKWRGLAVVELNHDQCTGCKTSVSVSTVKSVSQGNITYCGNCGRMLTQVH